MAASKPTSLNKRSEAKDIIAAKRDTEIANMPKTHISCKPPLSLRINQIASAVWERIISLQNETQTAQNGSPIITAFDEDLLMDYCKMISEAEELQENRQDLREAVKTLTKAANKLKIKDNGYEYFLEVWAQVNKLNSNFRGMDARLDTKRAHIKKAAESLYLKPRSRAGVPIT